MGAEVGDAPRGSGAGEVCIHREVHGQEPREEGERRVVVESLDGVVPEVDARHTREVLESVPADVFLFETLRSQTL